MAQLLLRSRARRHRLRPPRRSEEEIVYAAKAANTHEFIVGLLHGYESEVGERGMSLSGERQRIALTHAFMKDASILIFDEPTSSVDTKTETAIMEAMGDHEMVHLHMNHYIASMIAYRLGTLANCDVRPDIEGGCLAKFEQRTPAEEWLHQSKEISRECRGLPRSAAPPE
jgi:ATP-binding cassette, subfamily B, bacterial